MDKENLTNFINNRITCKQVASNEKYGVNNRLFLHGNDKSDGIGVKSGRILPRFVSMT